jgi:GTPase SAR1 family protein
MITHKGQVYKLSLWDTAGQEKFNSLIPSFVRGCDCAVIVYDVTNKESLKNCENWIKMARNGMN